MIAMLSTGVDYLSGGSRGGGGVQGVHLNPAPAPLFEISYENEIVRNKN